MQQCWIWKYCNKKGSKRIECNKYHKVLDGFLPVKVYLYRIHKIDEDIQVNRSSLIWHCFTEEVKYSPKCKFCNKMLYSC